MLSYLFISSIGLTLLALFYLIFLKRETFFQLNRFTILIGVMISILFPLLNILPEEQQTVIANTIPVITLPVLQVGDLSLSTTSAVTLSDHEIALLFYASVVFLFTIKFTLSNLKLWKFIVRNPKEKRLNKQLIITNGQYPTFAYLGYIFWDNSKKLSKHEADLILHHEIAHVKDFHSIDIFIMELLKCIFWFHPAIYIIDAALRTQHEYIADQKANQMTNDSSYRQLMVRSLFDELSISVGHGFQFSTIKSRINMLKQQRSAQWKRVHSIFSIVFLSSIIVLAQACVKDGLTTDVDPRIKDLQGDIVFGYAIDNEIYWTSENMKTFFQGYESEQTTDLIKQLEAVKDKNLFPSYISENVNNLLIADMDKDKLSEELIQKIKALPSSRRFTTLKEGSSETYTDEQLKNDVFEVVDQPAIYKGGMQKLYAQLAKEISYPTKAKELNIEGKVYIQFTVNQDGSLTDMKALKSPDYLLEEEALRAAQKVMTDWQPAEHQGQTVKQRLVMPISFKL
ncbi:TonB family protein [Flammeovirga agarivorans]|uniref:TonB family protein n=1 Tax=Flammeovirga agarivorans TaxID=2726742 RepID=A0A7X8XV07_9BACT|nr:TonB family protein [Flammeovirga agarivorans]NLR90769.1 TonB family protein [Flammeovirga agarivorans]